MSFPPYFPDLNIPQSNLDVAVVRAYPSIVFASQNVGKVAEIRRIFSDAPFSVLGMSDVGLADLDVEEVGEQFFENALEKARVVAQRCGVPALADDSGLCVASLGGEPGVHTKRWFAGSDADRNVALLERLAEKNGSASGDALGNSAKSAQNDRRAAFVSVLCLFDPQKQAAAYFKGIAPGRIIEAPRGVGEHGFGYDPIFIPEGYDQTYAQLGPEVKDTYSHRALALQALLAWVKG